MDNMDNAMILLLLFWSICVFVLGVCAEFLLLFSGRPPN